MAAEAVAAFGAIHILVNNAAIFILRGIDATLEEWRQMLDVNVMGPALVAKHVVPAIRKAGGGAIVNLASISSFIAQPNYVTYNTTKTAILGMTRCMAMDLAPDNIRVNAVCPGVVWTQIVETQAIAMGLDRAAADVHPQWAGAPVDPALRRPSRDRLRHPLPGLRRSLVHHRHSSHGGCGLHGEMTETRHLRAILASG